MIRYTNAGCQHCQKMGFNESGDSNLCSALYSAIYAPCKVFSDNDNDNDRIVTNHMERT